MNIYPPPKIILALDQLTPDQAIQLVQQLDPKLCRLKVGKELFTQAGPQIIKQFHQLNFSVFLDLKFHDIPTTVKQACFRAAELGVWMLNVHALGGAAMLRAAREGVDASSKKPLLIAVTILTSMSNEDIHQLGFSGTVEDHVLRLALLAKENGMDGIVCSPHEAPRIHELCGDDFCCVTPGVQMPGMQNDQKRVVTPDEAIQLGSDYLVMGRAITQANDPKQVLSEILIKI